MRFLEGKLSKSIYWWYNGDHCQSNSPWIICFYCHRLIKIVGCELFQIHWLKWFGCVYWTGLTFYRGCFQAAADALHISVSVPYLVDGLSAPQLHHGPQVHHAHPKVPFMVALSNRIPRRVVCRVVCHGGPLHSSVVLLTVFVCSDRNVGYVISHRNCG